MTQNLTVKDYVHDAYLFTDDMNQVAQVTVVEDMNDLNAYLEYNDFGEFFFEHYRESLYDLDLIRKDDHEEEYLDWSNLAHYNRGITEVIEKQMKKSLSDLGISHLSVYEADTGDRLPGFTLSFELRSHMLDFPVDQLEEHFWPLTSTIQNILDPGTYGSPFLFTSLIS